MMDGLDGLIAGLRILRLGVVSAPNEFVAGVGGRLSVAGEGLIVTPEEGWAVVFHPYEQMLRVVRNFSVPRVLAVAARNDIEVELLLRFLKQCDMRTPDA
jgi:hypothetical protein